MNTYDPTITRAEIAERIMSAHRRIAVAEHRVDMIAWRSPLAGDPLVPEDMPMPPRPDDHVAYPSLLVATTCPGSFYPWTRRSDLCSRIATPGGGAITKARALNVNANATPEQAVAVIHDADALAEQAEQEAADYVEAVIAAIAAWRQSQSGAVESLDSLVAGVREDIRQRDIQRAAALAAQRAAQQQEEAQAAAELADRDAWIGQHGTPRLRRLIAEGIECESLYLEERLALERPGWQWAEDVDGEAREVRNARQEGLDLLDEARRTDPAAKLVWWVVEHECDEDCEPDCARAETDRKDYACTADFLARDIVFGGPAGRGTL